MTPRDQIDWRAIQLAQAQVVSGIAIRMEIIEKAIDQIGTILATATGQPWKPISGKWPEWPHEDDPRFRKEPGDGPV